MTPNIDQLDKTLSHIETLDAFKREGVATDQWRQTRWTGEALARTQTPPTVQEPCGTAGCFAGWALLLNGYQLAPVEKRGQMGRYIYTPDGDRVVSVSEEAARLLGIDELDANRPGGLFFGANDLDDIRRIVGELREQA